MYTDTRTLWVDTFKPARDFFFLSLVIEAQRQRDLGTSLPLAQDKELGRKQAGRSFRFQEER